ncbi:MAG TPA: hypothetical protein ENK73_08730 [Thiomicrospira sp.]|jgi:hypothetical protein|nr:hypothetical protein [Thiomicrospira sp.]
MKEQAKKFKLLYMAFGLLGTILIVSTYFLPMWWVALQSIQYPKSMYPKGIRIEFKYNGVYNGCEGVREREELAMDAGANCLIEMNKINHFIGMYPIVQGVNDVDELGNHVRYPVYAGDSIPDDKIPGALKVLDKIMRDSHIVFGIFAILGLLFVFYDKKKLTWAAILTALAPFYFLIIYVYYLYWYGHHLGLHGGGAFNGIKPFMPTVFGEGKVAQFTTMSYPYSGFFVGLLGFILLILAVNFKNKYFKVKEA